jgi:hypothetical protein
VPDAADEVDPVDASPAAAIVVAVVRPVVVEAR